MRHALLAPQSSIFWVVAVNLGTGSTRTHNASGGGAAVTAIKLPREKFRFRRFVRRSQFSM